MINELESLRVLKHPNIIKFHGIYENVNAVFIVLEYGNGKDLKGVIDDVQEKIPEHYAANLMSQLFNVLEYCHKENVIHHDIKPENIIMQYFYSGL